MKSHHLKRVGKNTIIYTIGTICARATAFLLVPLYTHTLSISEYGMLATLLITIELMVVIINFGMRQTFLRFYGEYNKEKMCALLLGTTTAVCIVIFMIVTLLGQFVFQSLLSDKLSFSNPSLIIYLLCITSLMQSLFLYIQGFYRAKHEPTKYLVVGISYSVLMVGLTCIALIILKLNIKGILIAKILSYGTIVFFNYLILINKIGFKISLKPLLKFVKYGFPLIFSMSGEFVLGAAVVYFLNIFSNLETVAIYSLGNKLAGIAVLVFIYPFRLAFEPYVFSNIDASKIKVVISKSFTLFILIYIAVSFFLSAIMRFLIPVIAPSEYASAYIIILLILPIQLFYGLYFFGEILINLLKKTHITGMVVSISTLTSLVLYYLLIKNFHLSGAIMSKAIGYFMMGFFIIAIGIKLNKIHLEWNRIITILFLFAMNTTAFIFLDTIPNSIYYILILLLAAINVFIILFSGFLNQEEKQLFRELIQNIRNRKFSGI